MGELIHIANIIEESERKGKTIFEDFPHSDYKNTFLAIYRLRKEYKSFLQDFYSYLMDIISLDPTWSFWNSFENFLRSSFDSDPWGKLNGYLTNHGYPRKYVDNIIPTPSEEKLLEKIPSDNRVWITLIFYTYSPTRIQLFFLKHFKGDPLSLEARALLKMFNSLSREHQMQILEYARYFAERTNTQKKRSL